MVTRGRAFRRSERELLAAREHALRSGAASERVEVEHNLLHLYEAQGRAREARIAGEAFVAHAALRGLWPQRMMSARDAGQLLRRQGDIEGAHRFYRRMLADIDSLGIHAYYAGEYYELLGQVDSAHAYYRRA